jgi:predicted  nucleic acid-binding Zn-ribbon protein
LKPKKGRKKTNKTPKKGRENIMEMTLLQKAQVAVAELNGAALLVNNQMETGELNKSAVEKSISAAMRKAKRCQKLYFHGSDIRQMEEFTDANLDTEIDASIQQLNNVLIPYSKAVGWTG